MIKSLQDIYNEGICSVPPPGRYSVEMKFYGTCHRILEKTIKRGKGTNHAPVFILRRFKISLMDFNIHVVENEVIFKYTKLPLVDRLKKIEKDRWLGMIYWKDAFFDFFDLIKI